MRRLINGLILWVCVLSAPFSVAIEPAQELQELQEILQQTGVADAVQTLPFLYQQMINKEVARNSLDEKTQRLLATRLTIDSAVLLQELMATLQDKINGQPLHGVLSVLASPVMQKFQRFETMAGSTQQSAKMKTYQPATVTTPQRLTLLRDCNKASFTVAIIALLKSYAEVDAAKALDGLQQRNFAAGDPNGIELWRTVLEAEYKKQLHNEADDYLEFSYRFIRDVQIREYALLWQDKNIQWFMQLVVSSLHEVLKARQLAAI